VECRARRERKTGRVTRCYAASGSLLFCPRTVDEIDRDIVGDLILTDDASVDETVVLSRALGLHSIVHVANRG
jgi:hypothetical protein